MRRRFLWGGAAILLVVGALIAGLLTARAQPAVSLFGTATPPGAVAEEVRPVTLGVRFSADIDGAVTAIRFFKNSENSGPHVGALWTGDGQKLTTVTFDSPPDSGWQEARLDRPVAVQAGETYVASYQAPAGRYLADGGAFAQPFTVGHLNVPVGGGVFSYAAGAFPDKVFQNTNYYVDVLFVPSGTGVRSTPPVRPSPVASETAASKPPTAASQPPTAAPVELDPPSGPLKLKRIPWEGRDYWAQFAKADAAGWAEPTFFPIASWWSVATKPEDVAFDKSLGLNTYVVTNPDADYRLIENGGLFWVGGPLPYATPTSKNWVGTFLDDEVDGRFEPKEGYALLKERADASPPSTTGRFRYANYTSGLVSYDRDPAVTKTYTNAFTDAVSVDQYFYGTDQCDGDTSSMRWSTPQGSTGITPANCRTSSSYGKIVDLVREADRSDGKLQSIWNFVSVVGEDSHRLDFDKVQGQVMNSLIHEARGIIWFPQSFSGGCETGNAFRTYQTNGAPACLRAQVDGAKKINELVTSLAPVLNSQSYAWRFGDGLDTMLKVSGGSAYVFAMTTDGGTGKREFAIPAGISGTSVEVIGENRTIPISGSTFSDDFPKESSYHVYKINLTR